MGLYNFRCYSSEIFRRSLHVETRYLALRYMSRQPAIYLTYSNKLNLLSCVDVSLLRHFSFSHASFATYIFFSPCASLREPAHCRTRTRVCRSCCRASEEIFKKNNSEKKEDKFQGNREILRKTVSVYL